MAHNLITAFVFRGDEAEWTSVKLVKGVLEVVEHRTEPVSPDTGMAGSPAMAEAMAKIGTRLHGDVCFGIRSDRVLMRVVDLPTNDAAEMSGMVDLQVDKFSPFPVEHMAVSFEQLAQVGGSTRTLIAAVQRELVGGVGDAFRAVRALPRWIDVDLMGWWWLLKDRGEVPEQGLAVFLLLESDGANLIICEHGVPVVIRSLGAAAGVSEEEYHAELAEEIGYSLTTLEAEVGIAAGLQVAVWHNGETPPPKLIDMANGGGGITALAARIRDVCGAEVALRNLGELPPLSEGLARRAAARRGLVLDLAPAHWRVEAQGRITRKTLIFATLVFLVLWAGGLAAFFGGLGVERNKLAGLRAAVTSMEAPAEEMRALRDKIRSFEEYADRSHSALEALREMVVLLPQAVELTSFTYRKGASVNVRGIADQPDPIYDFFQSLERSPFFTKIETGDVRSRMVGNVQKSEFSVTAHLPAKEETKP